MIMRLTDDPKTLAEMKPDIAWSPAVQDVMKRALQRRALDRYQKAEDFGNALSDAVGRMPKNATAEVGTKLIDAQATVLQPTPATRVDPVAPSLLTAPTAVPLPLKSRTSAIIGGSAAAAAAVAVFFFMSKGGATPPVKHDSTAVIPPAVSSATTTPTQAQTQAPPPAPMMQGAQTMAKPIPVRPRIATPAVDISTRLPGLLRESAEDATAMKALSDAAALVHNAHGANEVVGLGLVRAQALGLLGRDKESCEVLNNIKDRAVGTKYDEDVQRLLKMSC
jgi:hypothetical protein